MRKVIVSEFLSLDGVMENPMWTFPYWNDEIAKFKQNELFTSDALLLGRVTYEGFTEAWPPRSDEEGYADRINSLPKFVASRTLDNAVWNASLIRDNIAEEVNRLKQQPGQSILLFGSGDFVQTLRQHDLIDQYNLLIYPLVLGKGQRLFPDGNDTKLKLVDSQIYSSGVIGAVYEPERNG